MPLTFSVLWMGDSRLTGLRNYQDQYLVDLYPKIKQGIMGNNFVT